MHENTPTTTWADHLAQYHQVDPESLQYLTEDPETVHWVRFRTCTWEPGMCAGDGPHSGWWLPASGGHGPDAVYKCGWCEQKTAGAEIGIGPLCKCGHPQNFHEIGAGICEDCSCTAYRRNTKTTTVKET